MSIEVVDFTQISDSDHEVLISESEPCECCGSREHLVLGVVTSGDDSGEYLILCSECHLDIEDKEENLV